MTHYVPFFTEIRRGLQTAVCGSHIFMHEHSVEPTCPVCLQWLTQDDAEAKALSTQWDREAAAKGSR